MLSVCILSACSCMYSTAKAKFTADLDSEDDFSGLDEKDEDEDFLPLDDTPPKTKMPPK